MRSLVWTLLCLLLVLPAAAATRDAKTDLWIAHLTQFTAAHPELTDEQRSVVFQGVDLLAAGMLKQLHSPTASEAADARRALDTFKARAAGAFPKPLYAEAFVRLGRSPLPAKLEKPGGAAPRIPDCDCAPGSGDCAGDCVTGSCRVMPDCGAFGTDICTGLCW